MIGNDVVDLDDEDSRAACRHPRFEARIFAAPERERIAASPDPDRMRAVLWAAKESAYKLLRRTDPRAAFSPSRFVVHWRSAFPASRPVGGPDGAGLVVAAAGRLLDVSLEAGDGFVHAVAREGGGGPAVLSAVRRLDECDAGAFAPGLAARRLAREAIAPRLGVEAARLSIVRDGRLPHLRCDGLRVAGGLSLSHHGRFVAFAWAPGDTGQPQGVEATPRALRSSRKRSRPAGEIMIQRPLP